jgi:hypothetical protein
LLTCAAPSRAQVIDNATVTILPSSSPAFTGYERPFALDTGADRFVTDFASMGQGVNTQLDFDFGRPIAFAEIRYTDRTTSGGPNGAFVGGTSDFVRSYQYIFATDAAFTNVVRTLMVGPLAIPAQPTNIASFQTTTVIPNITAQYLRWDVLTTDGANPGAADFQFTAVVPEPSSLALAALGAIGLLRYGWRRQRAKAQPVAS